MRAKEIAGFDPYSTDVIRDPYPYYAWLRREAPVYHNKSRGFWVLSRHADVVAAARNSKEYSSALGVGPSEQRIILARLGQTTHTAIIIVVSVWRVFCLVSVASAPCHRPIAQSAGPDA